MTSAPLPDQLTVVVVSPDAAFRRVAGAALSLAGHQVHTARSAPGRLGRLIRLRRPGVVVLDLAPDAELPESPDGVVFVRVADEEGPGVLARWGSMDVLVAHVERAAVAPPRLRLVVSDG